MKNKQQTKSLVMTAFFAAIIFLGIQLFRIPLPAAVGTPFLHFGHIFVMLAVICLGPVRSMVAALVGYLIFDLINGYVQSIPNVLFSTVVKCLLIGYIFLLFKKKYENEPKKLYTCAVITSAIYGVTNIVLDFIWYVCELVIMGSTLKAAVITELVSIPATAINAVFTVVGVAVLYVPATKAYKAIAKK